MSKKRVASSPPYPGSLIPPLLQVSLHRPPPCHQHTLWFSRGTWHVMLSAALVRGWEGLTGEVQRITVRERLFQRPDK